MINTADDVVYPDEDGKPVAESDFQREPLFYAVKALQIHFQDRPDVYVSGNMFIYYEQGNPKAVVAPDVFVVIGAPKHDRSSYLLWKEPKAPDFVLEITSKSTLTEDQGPKRGIYAFLGVSEYWQYDPTGDYLDPTLRGFRLMEGNYQPIPSSASEPGRRVLRSVVLNLDLHVENNNLRFVDPGTRRILLSHEETELARQQAELKRRQAEQARQQAEQARQQAEQARQQAEQARQQAEQARQQAEESVQREAALREVAETRIAELEARLRALEEPPSSSAKPPASDDRANQGD
jgi:Uma2 family endonuclease